MKKANNIIEAFMPEYALQTNNNDFFVHLFFGSKALETVK